MLAQTSSTIIQGGEEANFTHWIHRAEQVNIWYGIVCKVAAPLSQPCGSSSGCPINCEDMAILDLFITNHGIIDQKTAEQVSDVIKEQNTT